MFIFALRRYFHLLPCLALTIVTLPITVLDAQGQPVQAFDLSAVRLDESDFARAQNTDLEYILALDVDRLLAPFLREAGMPERSRAYGNWESSGLDGHIGGHYLSALALMRAATGNEEVGRRLDYMVDQLAKCQKQNGGGYVGGVPGGKELWEQIRRGEIRADNFSLNGKWVPLYNIHKLYAGLYDAFTVGQNAQARSVFVSLCEWFLNLTSAFTDAQFQEMLRSEHGGLNEVFAQAAEVTGNPEFLLLARKMSHQKILRPLKSHVDSLTGLHANTQIPKVIGFKKIGDISRDSSWNNAATFFWKTVVSNRTVSIGGNSVREHFHPATDFSSMLESNQGPETCNTYNMARLSRSLFLSDPQARYIDYYERAIYNHILSSQHPERGGFVYFTPMRPRHYRVYSSRQESFWCCVGSGLENHGKYGELIYAHRGSDVFVNLFIPSTLTWTEKSLRIRQVTNFPYSEESTVIIETKRPRKFAVHVRRPSWAREFTLLVNGSPVRGTQTNPLYLTIDRKWKNGDRIELRMKMETQLEYLPDGSPWASFVHGPVVLAAAMDSTDLRGLIADDSRMGHVAEGKFFPVDEAPVLLKDRIGDLSSLKRVDGAPLTFEAGSLIEQENFSHLRLTPFHSIHDRRYMIYWLVATQEKLDEVRASIAKRERDAIELKKITIDEITLGEQQPEVEHNFRGSSTFSGSSAGQSWRATTEWLSYELRDPASEARVLRITTLSGARRKFDVFLNEILVASLSLNDSYNDKAVVHDFVLPVNLESRGKPLTITIKAHPSAETGRIHSIRLLR
jgi:hypothetical protein